MSNKDNLTKDVGTVAEHTGVLLGLVARGEPVAEMRRQYCTLLKSFIDRWEGASDECPVTGEAVDSVFEVNGVLMGQPLAMRFMAKDPEALRLVEEHKTSSAQSTQEEEPVPRKPVLSVVETPKPPDTQDDEAQAIKEALDQQGKDGPQADQATWGTLGPEEEEEPKEDKAAGETLEVDKEEVAKLAQKVRGSVLEGHEGLGVVADTLSDQIEKMTGWSPGDAIAFLALFVRAHTEYEEHGGKQAWLISEFKKIKDSRYKREGPLSDSDIKSLWITEAVSSDLAALQAGEARLDLEGVQTEGILDRMTLKPSGENNDSLAVAVAVMIQIIFDQLQSELGDY